MEKTFYVLRMKQQENSAPVYFVDGISLDESAVAIYDDLSTAYQVANQLNINQFMEVDQEKPEEQSEPEEVPEYSTEEYPSKLVRFEATDTLKLFRRKPNNKQSKTCIFISNEAVEAFKKAATNKGNYSLEREYAPEVYAKWNNYFNKIIKDRNL